MGKAMHEICKKHPAIKVYSFETDQHDCFQGNPRILFYWLSNSLCPDRLNGNDKKDHPRNIIQLLADYGHTISSLYRNQMFEIERTFFG